MRLTKGNFHARYHKLKSLLTTVAALTYLAISSTTFGESLTAVSPEFRPVSYYSEEGKLKGVSPEFIQRLSEETGFIIHTRREPLSRTLQSLSTGRSDFGISFRSKKTDHILDPMVKLRTIDTVIIGKKNITIINYSDLKKLKIAIPRGALINERFDNDKDLKKIRTNNYRNQVKLLAAGRVDAITGNIDIIIYEWKKLGLSPKQLGSPYKLAQNEVWLSFSKASKKTHLKLALKTAAETLRKQGEFDELYKKHFFDKNLSTIKM